MRRFFAAILGLLERPAPAANASGNELTPRVLGVSVDAKSAWVAFYDRIETEMARDGVLADLRDVASKAAENAARIAGVLTIVEDPDALAIKSKSMAAGCELMLWYLTEALRLAGQHRQPEALRNAIKLLDWLRSKDKSETSVREIMRFGPSPVRSKIKAEAALAKLEEHGWLEKHGEGRGARWTVITESRQ